MRRSPLAVLLLACVCATAWPARAAAQLDDASFWSGTHALRRILHARKFVALRDWDRLDEAPSKTLLVLLGNPVRRGESLLDNVPGRLTKFLRDGGAALIATDSRLVHEDLTEVCGYGVQGAKVSAWPGNDRRHRDVRDGLERRVPDDNLYRGLPGCIIPEALDAVPPLFLDPLKPLERSKLRVATNRPSYLASQGQEASVLARFPRGCYYTDRGYLFPRWAPPPFAVCAEPGDGRVLLLADHSVFLNDMMLEGVRQADNDNFAFAFNVVDWLRGKAGQRRRVLFVEDGYVERQLDTPLEIPEGAIRQALAELAEKVNTVAKGVQEKHARDNTLNRVLINGIGAGNFYRLLIGAAVVALVVYGGLRLMRAAHRVDLALPLFGNIAGKFRPAGSTLAMRQKSALVGDDLREYAREAAREWFAALPGCPEFGEAAMPHVEARGGWWKRTSLRNEVHRLWRTARGEDQPRMTQTAFQQFVARLDRLQSAVESGDLQIHW
jgi:hypothetical protein